MRWNRKRRALLQEFEHKVTEQLAGMEATVKQHSRGVKIAVTAAWVTGTLAVLAGGMYLGKELRSRYKLKRRTPYDYYAHSGDRRKADLEFGVGI